MNNNTENRLAAGDKNDRKSNQSGIKSDEKNSLIRTKKYKATIILTAVGIAGMTCFWKYSGTDKNAVNVVPVKSKIAVIQNGGINKPFIHPPFKGIKVPGKIYNVDASKGGVLNYNKSVITIPANAFCDEKGNEVKGDIQIEYREFHNAIDFFVSGIPMTYDSGGMKYNFESAGMLEIQGTQNGKPIYVKQGKNMQVAMSSYQTGTKYNVYKLDTIKKNWTFIEKTKFVVQTKEPAQIKKMWDDSVSEAHSFNEIAAVKKQIKNLEYEKPVKADDNGLILSIEADAIDFPELSVFKNMVFEVDARDKEYKSEWGNTEWNDAKLTCNDTGKVYVFTVRKVAEKHSILVHPVFQGENYEKAMNEYNKKYGQYMAQVKQKEEEVRKQKEAHDKMIADQKRKREEEIAEKEKQKEENQRLAAEKLKKEQEKKEAEITKIAQEQKEQREQKEASDKQNIAIQLQQQEQYGKTAVQSAVTNYFKMNQFGVWNSDCPQSMPKGAWLNASYTDKNNDNFNNCLVYLVQRNKNSLVIEDCPVGTFSFDTDENNFAWTVTPDSKLAVYGENDFKKIDITSGDFTFVFKVLDNKFETYDDICEALKPYM